jgi:cell division inhibitor SepF
VNTIFGKLKDFVGLNEADEDYGYAEDLDPNDYPEQNYEEQERFEERNNRRRNRSTYISQPETGMESNINNKVVGMPGLANASSEVVIIEPHSFEEMPEVIKTLRERRSVILNLNVMEPEEAQRAVDFVAGGTYAMDGHQERIGESIFLFTPSCVKVSTLTGIVHDVQEIPTANLRKSSSSTPNWAPEATRIAQ